MPPSGGRATVRRSKSDLGVEMAGAKTWALVINGVRARIVRGLESGEPEEPIEMTSAAESTHLGEILSDKAGRSFASSGDGRRSAMEPGSDPVHREMENFARETLGALERHRRAGAFERLLVVAAPAMLGILRDEMPPGLKPSILVERAANLVQLGDPELRTALRKILHANRPNLS